jgi:ATP-dependent exoDNAse (exonuclease V) alpha subunit
MQLNEDQLAITKKVIEGKNIFIDGPGGVGKSVTVNHIRKHFGESTVFLAPTGIAALNIDGATIHSTFKFPFNVLWKKDHGQINESTREVFDKDGPVKRIVIDEISMVRVDLFRAIDQQLRKIRRLKHSPFGGLQIIVVGDFYQLSPVLTPRDKKFFDEHFDSPFAFTDSTWSEAQFEHCPLDKIMRQNDVDFISNLMKIRNKVQGWEQSVSFFNNVGLENKEQVLDEDPVFLCTTNKAANAINEQNYQELDEKEKVFTAAKKGKFGAEPSPFDLKLKFGTKIIFTANHDDFKNGQTGYVVGFVGDKIEVILEHDESKILVEKYRWEEKEYAASKDKGLYQYPVGSYTQYPLKHGWAATIHKCQGQSLDHGIIHLGNGAFCHGQTYVALSRMRTLEGLALFDKILKKDIIVDESIHEFYENDCKGIGLF